MGHDTYDEYTDHGARGTTSRVPRRPPAPLKTAEAATRAIADGAYTHYERVPTATDLDARAHLVLYRGESPNGGRRDPQIFEVTPAAAERIAAELRPGPMERARRGEHIEPGAARPEVPGCARCEAQAGSPHGGPSHYGSRLCRNGRALAAGGSEAHCTCAACF